MEYKAKKFTKSKQVEQHFTWLRMKALEGYPELLRLDGGGLAKLLLAGVINGFGYTKAAQDVERQLAAKRRRLQMLDNEERACLAELRRRGITYS